MKNQGNYFTAKGNSIDDVPVKPPADEKGYYATTAIADHAVDAGADQLAYFVDGDSAGSVDLLRGLGDTFEFGDGHGDLL